MLSRHFTALDSRPATVLDLGERVLSTDRCATLDLESGAVVLRRLVTLCGSSTGTPFVEADTTIVPSRLPPAFMEALHREPRGLGAALRAAGVVVRKELLWYGWLPGEEPLLTRTHRLTIDAVPVFLVGETFLPRTQLAAA